MKLSAARIGFACNSSSTHSIILLPEGESADSDSAGGEFGWDFFTTGTREGKLKYLALQVRSALTDSVPEAYRNAVVSELVGVRPGDGDYVDHQSLFALPNAFATSWGGARSLHRGFIADFVKHVAENPRAVVLGGNDNTEREHHLRAGNERLLLDIPSGEGPQHWIARRDGEAAYTFFNTETGAKARVTLDGSEHPAPRAPELVDLKITDYCDFGCEFCYQGSTREGVHADMDVLMQVIGDLASHEVFELAIGGGEPTKHPGFPDIIELAARMGIKPNFTTRNLGFLVEDWAPDVLKKIGAFAFSTEHAGRIGTLARACEKHGVPADKVVVQLIPALLSTWELGACFARAADHGFGVTLLGYKTTGRGGQFTPDMRKREEAWVEVLKARRVRLGIDTVLAARSESALKSLEIPSWLYSVQEGTRSMYVDAVAKSYARSSFESAPRDYTGFSKFSTVEAFGRVRA